jgi:hypothetical protein
MEQNWRVEQIKEWEQSRSAEIKMDLAAHWSKCIGALVPTALAWWLVEYFNPPFAGTVKAIIAYLCAVHLLGRIIVWLRTWGAYVERQLIDVKALISDTLPSYYSNEDIGALETNVLFKRLTEIEDEVRAIRIGRQDNW